MSKQLIVDDNITITMFTGDKVESKNIVNALYTKYKVNELRTEYEKQNNIQYDMVLNTRTDILYKNEFRIQNIIDIYDSGLLKGYESLENKLFYGGAYRDWAVKDDKLLMQSDIFYFAKPETMNKVSNIYSQLNIEDLKNNFIVWEYFFFSQIQQLNVQAIQVSYSPFTDWHILRFTDIHLESSESLLQKKYTFKTLVKLFIPPIVIKLIKKMRSLIDIMYGSLINTMCGLQDPKQQAIINDQIFAAEYIQENYLKKTLEPFTVKAKKDLGTNKIIWQYWAQDIDINTPQIVKTCIASVEKHKGEYIHIVLTNKNISDYIDLPDFVFSKLQNNGDFTYAFFSDLLRVALLHAYGGIWCDITIFLSNSIPQNILKREYFIFYRGSKPKDYKQWIDFNQDYFQWNKKWKVNMLSSFMVSKKESPLTQKLLNILLNYWKNEENLKHYFLFQIIYNEITSKYKNRRQSISDILPHLLQKNIHKPYTEKLWNKITKNNHIHKFTYFTESNTGSILEFILKDSN